VRKSAAIRLAVPTPTNEEFRIRLAGDALLSMMKDLRNRADDSGTPHSVAQVLLAEAHIAEAVGLLRAIYPIPSLLEVTPRGSSPRPAPPARSRVQRPRQSYQAHGLAG
jgi:hypothetical protein